MSLPLCRLKQSVERFDESIGLACSLPRHDAVNVATYEHCDTLLTPMEPVECRACATARFVREERQRPRRRDAPIRIPVPGPRPQILAEAPR
jgi:hypothetical protein